MTAPQQTGAPDPSPSDGATPRGAPHADNPPRGILLILITLLFFSCSDAAAKALTYSLAPLQIVAMRYALFAALIVPLGLIIKGPGVFRSFHPGWQSVRGLGVYGSALFFTSALQFLPLAESIAINFVSPIIITALAIPFLGEQVGIRRWIALVIGLLGVLIIIRPGTDAFHPAAIFPLLSATSWAFAMIGTRKTSSTDNVWTALIYSALIGLAVSAGLAPFVWTTPTAHELLLSVGNGGFSTLAQLILIFAYRFAPASVLAPFSYSQIIWSVGFGYVLFSEVPDRWTLVGAAVVIASGLYTAHRERVVAQDTRRKILTGS